MRLRFIFTGFVLVAAACRSHSAEPAIPTADEILSYLGLDADAKREMLSGKIVSKGIKEGSDKELAVTVSMVVEKPVPEVFEAVRSGKAFQADREMLAEKDLGSSSPRVEDFAEVNFTKDETAEVRELLRVAPGSKFNLDAPEIEAFRKIKRRFPARDAERDPACIEAVAAEYRRILHERCRAYCEKGLDGIAPYAREGKQRAKAGEELRSAARAAKLLEDYFPALHRAFLNYPRDDGKEFAHRFYWVKQKVEDRPTFILSHRIFYSRPEGALITDRQFYVGHSYNSIQIIVGCLPRDNKTIVFYTNRTSTDQVAGFASGLRHSVGRSIMSDQIVAYFEELRSGKPAPSK